MALAVKLLAMITGMGRIIRVRVMATEGNTSRTTSIYLQGTALIAHFKQQETSKYKVILN